MYAIPDLKLPPMPARPSTGGTSAAGGRRHRQVGLLLCLYIGLAATWTWRMNQPAEPAEDPMPRRLARLEQAASYLGKAPAEVARPILMGLALLPDTRLEALESWLALPPALQLRALTVQDTPFLKESGNLGEALLLAWLEQEKISNPAEAHLMVAAAGKRVDDQVKLYALERLAARARTAGEVDTAREILDHACDLPTATWNTVSASVLTAQNPAAALRTVQRWISLHEKRATPAMLEPARAEEFNLMMRLQRAEAALETQINLLHRTPTGEKLPDVVLERALGAARSGRQHMRVLPWLDKHLRTWPEHELGWKALMDAADLDPGYRRWLHHQAAILDAELPAAQAFDALLRLAATGERTALARLAPLATAIRRTDECTLFLTRALEQPALRPALLELAQTEPLVRKVVANALHKAPGDRALHYAAALAEAAAAKSPTAATMVWQGYLRRFPDDAPASRRLIQVCLKARLPGLALRVYETMNPATLTEEDRRQKAMLGGL